MKSSLIVSAAGSYRAAARWALAFAFVSGAYTAGAQRDDRSPHSEMSAGMEYRTVQPGGANTLVVHIAVEKGWHTYWKNGGDAGFPLAINWRLPPGYEAGELRLPLPRLLPTPPLMSYGYKESLTALVDIRVPPDVRSGSPVRLEGEVTWLVCSDVCLPASDSLVVEAAVSNDAPLPNVGWAERANAARARLPLDASDWNARAWSTDSGYMLALEPAPGTSLPSPYFFVDSAETLDHAAAQRVRRIGGAVYVELRKSEFALATTSRLRGVLAADVGGTGWEGWLIDAPVAAASPIAADSLSILASAVPQETGGFAGVAAGTGDTAEASTLTFLVALALAFAGGLLLNLMPCVFPVLSLKVLSFIDHGARDPRRARLHGAAFAAGVVISFWVLAGVLLALRAGGESLGWGFQLQSPMVVAVLALLLFALGLNMSGLYEVGLTFTRLGSGSSGDRLSESVLTGGLAVLVATPCTAPFMGAALGFAVVQPALVGMAVFTSLAVGLAAPYVVLSSAPRLLARLPRAGAWMITVKQLLAFPLYATVVWLVWVFGKQAGIDATALLLLALVVTALAGWLWGRSQMTRGRVARIVAPALVAGSVALLALGAGSSATEEFAPEGARWGVYSDSRLAALRAEGHPVFVDFTAAWCLSCQVNERVALGKRETLEAFDETGTVLLRADWTSRDAEIARALQSFGRTGVPLYVVYPADSSRSPEILPTILTPSMVIKALRRAAAPAAP